MKKYFNKILMSAVIVLGILGFASCTDYLDKSPLSDIESDDAFKNFKNFQGFTEELYNCIPVITASDYHNTWNWGDDEMWEPGETRLFAYCIDQGDYWSWNTAGYSWLKNGGDPAGSDRFQKGKLWGLSWYAIRKANIGLANLDKLIEATDEEKALIAGQLYFFRGWFHFQLMQYWGGLPYIDQVLPSDQVLKLPRLNYQETANKVAEDLQKAADLLPVDWDQTAPGKQAQNNNIRVNKVMAYGYLGKNYLYAGSPLMNSESTGSTAYNVDYCKKAADAFAKALTICETTKGTDGYALYSLVPFNRYSEIFYTYNAAGRIPGKVTDAATGEVWRESIFMEGLAGANGRWRWNQVNDYRPQNIISSGIKCYPTANYVDFYGMANGLPIANPESADPESGYDPAYPWRNRDPRFYNDIIYDGVKLSVTTKPEATQYASLYTGGLCRTANTAAKGCFTGYMNTKFVHPLTNEWDGYRENTNFILSLMRLSDVYLMYAEATIVGYGTPTSKATDYNLTALDAINKIRDRAGVGRVNSKYIGSTESLMPELRRERAVELAFEGHRFNDLRRWLLLAEKPYTTKKVLNFDRAKDVTSAQLYANPKEGHVLNFKETVFFERQLGLRHNWFPFLKSDVNIYKEFKQNPGW